MEQGHNHPQANTPEDQSISSGQGDIEDRLHDLEQWKVEHAKRVQEWCEAMSEWCLQEHREVERLKLILKAAGAAFTVPGFSTPSDEPPNPPVP